MAVDAFFPDPHPRHQRCLKSLGTSLLRSWQSKTMTHFATVPHER